MLGGLIYGVWNWPQPVFLAVASAYVASGIAIRIAALFADASGASHDLRAHRSESLLAREIRDLAATPRPLSNST